MQGPYKFNRRWRGVLLYGSNMSALRFLVSFSGFSLTSFLVSRMGVFLGQGSRLHLDQSDGLCGCDRGTTTSEYCGWGFLSNGVDGVFQGSSVGVLRYRMPIFPLTRGEKHAMFFLQIQSP